ncbi:MAG: hypothetical protein FWF71_02600 [Actinomycetia bacterium]|nr:hypothetical protein [Actinomycetes bacterium]
MDEPTAKELLSRFPHLADHACRQCGYGRFGDKIIGASLPHLCEHLAIDLLVSEQLAVGSRQLVAGNTVWLDKGQRLAKVRLRLSAELLENAESAICQAVETINELMGRSWGSDDQSGVA